MTLKTFYCTATSAKTSIGLIDRLLGLAQANTNLFCFLFAPSKQNLANQYSAPNIVETPSNPFLKYLTISSHISNFFADNRLNIVILRYSPCAIYLWPIYILYPSIWVEFHGIPDCETSHRGNQKIRKILLFIESLILNIHVRNYLAVTSQINSYIRASYRYNETLISPNLIGYPKFSQHCKIILSASVGLYEDNLQVSPPHRPYPTRLVFIASNLSQPWQGIDILLNLLKQYCLTYEHSNVQLDIYGDSITDSIRKNIQDCNDEVHNLYILHNGSSKSISPTDLIAYDAGVAPLALSRKGLTSSCALKTRTYLSRGLPVLSNHSDDAFRHSIDFKQRERAGYYQFDSQLSFNKQLNSAIYFSLKYPFTKRLRYIYNSKVFLELKSANFIYSLQALQ